MFSEKMKNNKQKGFTLVEMIIVVVIIGILAGITITVINIPLQQRRSRDARRIADLKMVQSALELYFSDNRSYPNVISFSRVNLALNDSLVIGGYISDLPKDPRDSAGTPSGVTCGGGGLGGMYVYRYGSGSTSGTKYVLMATMETIDRASESLCRNIRNCKPDSGIDCGSVGDYCYCVQNPM